MQQEAEKSLRREQSTVEGCGVPLLGLALVGLAIAPVWLRTHGDGVAAMAIVAFFSKVCHQRPERTLFLSGLPIAVCVRCLGLYLGAACGSLFRPSRIIALRGLATAIVLNALDGATESLSWHGNLPLLRFAMGLLLGVTAGGLLASRPALSRFPKP